MLSCSGDLINISSVVGYNKKILDVSEGLQYRGNTPISKNLEPVP